MDRAATGIGLRGLCRPLHIPFQSRNQAVAAGEEARFIRARPDDPKKSARQGLDEAFRRGNVGEGTFTNGNTPPRPLLRRRRLPLGSSKSKPAAPVLQR